MFGFEQLIKSATRITLNSATLLDNFFTNVNSDLFRGIFSNDITDHLPIFLMSKKIKKNENIPHNYSRKVTDEGIHLLNEKLTITDWSEVFNTYDTTAAYDVFIAKLTMLYEEIFLLTKTKKKNIRKPWITPSLLRCTKKHKLYKRFLRNRTSCNEKKYKDYRNKLNNLLRHAKKKFYSSKLKENQNNMKDMWSVINTLLNKPSNESPTYFLQNDDKICDSQTIADEFNSYFINCCNDALSSMSRPTTNLHFKDYLKDNFPHSLYFNPTTESELIKICKSLKTTYSCGFDNLSCNTLKRIIFSIVKPLVHIFNLSLSTGDVPPKLKIAKIAPIHKKDDPHLLKNYRPISILPAISKLLEKCVYDRFYPFLSKFNILSNCQYGFRRNHSTSHAVTDLEDKIISAITLNKHAIGIFMDLSKAFDILVVDHTILLFKL